MRKVALSMNEQEKKKYAPPMTHPWKSKFWEKYINSQNKGCKNSGDV